MLQPPPIKDLQILSLPHFTDLRGSFTKVFHEDSLRERGIDFTLRESYYSFSAKGVIRGMHFQTPPAQHAKIVFCPVGEILDVVLDIRTDSPTFGQHFSQILSAQNHLALYIPEGCAHGFRALSEGAMTFYLVSSVHNPDHDKGIRWDSFGFDWGVPDSILSDRDKGFPTLEAFRSPF